MITGFLFPSDIVGFADDGHYAYGCEAITPVTACRMPRKRLFEFFETYPKLERRMLEIATNELAATQDQMLLLGRRRRRKSWRPSCTFSCAGRSGGARAAIG